MAFGKTAVCLIALALCAPAADLAVRHRHWNGTCTGSLQIDAQGIRYSGSKNHAWQWKFEDIQQLQLDLESIQIVTYKDNKLQLGADREFHFSGEIPAEELYPELKDHMDQRLIAHIGHAPQEPSLVLPAKHRGRIAGSEGTLSFGSGSVSYATGEKGESRSWRYSDLLSISSSSPFELTIATLEKEFHFQLKQPLPEARYNELWLEIEKKNGKIQ